MDSQEARKMGSECEEVGRQKRTKRVAVAMLRSSGLWSGRDDLRFE